MLMHRMKRTVLWVLFFGLQVPRGNKYHSKRYCMYDHEETEIVKITRNKQGLRLCQTHFKLPLHLVKETKNDAVGLTFQLKGDLLCLFYISYNY